jgi:xanthosine utilization system XapX-like protein
MFPVSLEVIFVSLAEFVVIGSAVGALSGLLAYRILKTSRPRLPLDAFLGLFGFYAGFGVLIHMPWQYYWPRDTPIAILIAAIPPVLYEYSRSKRTQRASKSTQK